MRRQPHGCQRMPIIKGAAGLLYGSEHKDWPYRILPEIARPIPSQVRCRAKPSVGGSFRVKRRSQALPPL